jgi:hypothetical protein
VDAVQKEFIKQSELKKKEKEEKKILDSKSGGYLDEADLPPSMSDDDEGGEWIEEEEEVEVQLQQQQQQGELKVDENVLDGFKSEAVIQPDCQLLQSLKIAS